MKKYYPILLSKKGEIDALLHLTQPVKDHICPVVEVLQSTLEMTQTKDGISATVSKDEFESFLKTHWSFPANQIILDFSLFDNIDSRISNIKDFIVRVVAAGVNVIPALQVNISVKFIELVKDLIKEYELNVCIRTSDNSGGIDYFKLGIDGIRHNVDIKTSNIVLLLDLGYVKGNTYNTLTAMVKAAINTLSEKTEEWAAIVIASSSFPEDLTEIKPAHTAQPHKIERYEWKIWEALQKDPVFKNLKYGDFGTKHAFFTEAKRGGTVSVKYSVKDYFLIYKGELTGNHKSGHGQYVMHAVKLIKHPDYSGKDFSWGDMRIFEISNENLNDNKTKPKTGSSTTWVQISQNHHITLIDSLL